MPFRIYWGPPPSYSPAVDLSKIPSSFNSCSQISPRLLSSQYVLVILGLSIVFPCFLPHRCGYQTGPVTFGSLSSSACILWFMSTSLMSNGVLVSTSSKVCFCMGTKGYSNYTTTSAIFLESHSPNFGLFATSFQPSILLIRLNEHHWYLSHSPSLGGKINCFLSTPFGRHCISTVQAQVVLFRNTSDMTNRYSLLGRADYIQPTKNKE